MAFKCPVCLETASAAYGAESQHCRRCQSFFEFSDRRIEEILNKDSPGYERAVRDLKVGVRRRWIRAERLKNGG